MNDYLYDGGGLPAQMMPQGNQGSLSDMPGSSLQQIPQSSHQMQGQGGSGNNQKERFARENHSEIERRRRNKMTHYINELAEMVPQCAALASGRKPDKLTILRMAVTHMKQIREISTPTDPALANVNSYKPTFLTDQELKHMILEAANGFLFVAACDSGRVLYVADSILPVLNLRQEEWLGHSIYDLVHPDDMDKVRDQLCASEANLNRTLDLKSGSAKKEQRVGPPIHMGCRRGFICRMRLGNIEPLHRLRNRRPLFTHNGQTYVVMHCTGYVKQTPPQGVEQTNASCLVGVARLQVASMPTVKPDGIDGEQFCMRWNEEGKITFVDQRVYHILDVRADELNGRYCWQGIHPADEQTVRDAFTQLMQNNQPFQLTYRFARPNGVYSQCTVDAFKFLNPYSEQFEYVVATARLIDPAAEEIAANQQLPDLIIHQNNPIQPAGFEGTQWNQNQSPGEPMPAASMSNYQPQLAQMSLSQNATNPAPLTVDPWLNQIPPIQQQNPYWNQESAESIPLAQSQWNYLNQ
ncbi:unnamed protein product [Bursaphelenchus xylophilus]|uniref:Aryl hydrocarbon receptor nuclear translocator homolog n=1 Tax=Bursaphelenchus xylophilus TaxID=6326 RepID=A0A1I7S200_BURXY|nr:unnamed protein product [Bursaphelenchus xylophilus]CAG9090207.1 unnamed protein product [Bursaphelenchus xylophilus]